MTTQQSGASPLLERFDRIAAALPDTSAVIDGGIVLSYAELSAAANALARELAPWTGRAVGLRMDRSAASVLAALACARAGVTYVPLGMDWPDPRLERIARRCALAALLCVAQDAAAQTWAGGLPLIHPDLWLQARAAAPATAPAACSVLYIMHTSGTSGEPKGARISHAGVHAVFSTVSRLGYLPGRRMVHGASMTFDMSIMELWGGLLNGCTLVIAQTETLLDAARLEAFLAQRRVELLLLPTSVFNVTAAQNPAAFRRVSDLCFGGEMPSRDAVLRARDACPNLSLHNCYGPTECTVFAAAQTVDEAALALRPLPAGTPVGCARFLIMDENGTELPRGSEGELVIAGPTVGLGYTSEPSAARPAFFSLPDGTACYRTGDLARLDERGVLFVLGRSDDQIKISGCRVEPGEVCACLQRSPLVRVAHVAARRNPSPALMGYVVPHHAEDADDPLRAAALADELKAFMRGQAPDYMVPRVIMVLKELPLTSGGKIDAARLPQPEERGLEQVCDPVLAAFKTVLDDAAFDWDHSFLEAGGSSIMAARLIAALREHSGVAVPFSLIMEPRTAAAARLYIDNARLAQSQASQAGGAVAARI